MTTYNHNASEVANIPAQRGIVKPRLLDLINKHGISTIHLARAARLRLDVVRAMALQGRAVQPVVAMRVLYGLLQLTGCKYLLTDIDMPTLPYLAYTK